MLDNVSSGDDDGHSRDCSGADRNQRPVNLNALFKWAAEQGLDCSKIKTCVFGASGWGICARRLIEMNSPVAKVPWPSRTGPAVSDATTEEGHVDVLRIPEALLWDCIEARRAIERHLAINVDSKLLLANLLSTLACEDLLAVNLALEMSAEKSSSDGCGSARSRWAPYLNSLPAIVDLPVFWTDAERTLLGEEASYVCTNHLEHTRKLADKPQLSHISSALLLHCWALVNTRCVFVDRSPTCGCPYGARIALVAVFDLLNHVPSAQTHYGFNASRRLFFLSTKTPVAKGEQLCITYGEHDNAALLAEYGFLIADNPFDAVVVPNDIIETSCKKLQLKVPELETDSNAGDTQTTKGTSSSQPADWPYYCSRLDGVSAKLKATIDQAASSANTSAVDQVKHQLSKIILSEMRDLIAEKLRQVESLHQSGEDVSRHQQRRRLLQDFWTEQQKVLTETFTIEDSDTE